MQIKELKEKLEEYSTGLDNRPSYMMDEVEAVIGEAVLALRALAKDHQAMTMIRAAYAQGGMRDAKTLLESLI